MDMKEKKNILRNEIKRKIECLDASYRHKADKKIYERVINLKEYAEADTVFLFAGTFGEPDTWPIINHALSHGKCVGLPLCINNFEMKVLRIRVKEDVETGMLGILEPKASCEEINPESINFVMVPCMTCDIKGGRLGHGKGYYDRFLAKCPDAFKCLVCYDRLMAEEVPMDKWDINMNLIVGEVTELYVD